jgi:hypothetical protein
MVRALMVLLTFAKLICPRVYVPEILPLHARAKGTAIGISSNWLWVSFCIHSIIAKLATNSKTELCRCHDHTNPHQQPPMASLPHLHVHKPGLCTSSLFLVRLLPPPRLCFSTF